MCFMCFKLWVFSVLVNDLYVGDPLEADKHRIYAYSSKTLLMNTLISCELTPSLAVCIGHITVFFDRTY